MNQLLKHALHKGICDKNEYNEILKTITPGCKMLVFGLGYDSPLWLAANSQGQTIFLEDDVLWIDKCSVLPGIVKVSYNTEYWDNTKIYDEQTLHMPLPDFVEKTSWDIIFVDAPVGSVQGRMKSIYNAYRLARKAYQKGVSTTVFVHDYNRKSEKTYVDHFFKNRIKSVTNRLVKVIL